MKGFKSQKVSSAANRTALLNPRRSTLPRAACCPDIFFPLVNSMLPTQLQSKPRLYKGCCSCNFSDIFFHGKRWSKGGRFCDTCSNVPCLQYVEAQNSTWNFQVEAQRLIHLNTSQPFSTLQRFLASYQHPHKGVWPGCEMICHLHPLIARWKIHHEYGCLLEGDTNFLPATSKQEMSISWQLSDSLSSAP